MKYKKPEHHEHAGKHMGHAAHPAKEAHAATTPTKGLSAEPVTIALVLIIVALLAFIGYNSFRYQPPSNNGTAIITPNQTVTGKQAKINMELFVMSYCPYGVQAESAVKKVMDKFGGEVNLSLHFIASQDANGTFESMHGPNEVQEDLRQVCIMKYYPNSIVGYVGCVASGYPNIGDVWQSCATQNNIDVNKINSCSNSNEAVALLADNVKRTDALNVQASPTIYLNGTQYGGSASESSLTQAICTDIPGSDTCKNLPPEVSVGLTVVNDKNCIICDSSQIVNALKSQFQINKLVETDVDYSSDEGKALIREFNLTGVPAYILNASIANHDSYSSLSQYLHKVGSSYVLLVQPSKLVNTIEVNNTIQLFVMSWCPYGTAAEKAMNELLAAIPDLKFTGLHFIANQNSDGTFTSLHGDGEVKEDLRQVCIMKYYNSKLFSYLMCIDANVSNSESIWQGCATNNGIDASRIGNCSTDAEGKTLLADNIQASHDLSIYSSPTLLFENSTIFNSVSADQMRQVVCSYSPALAGCNKTLSGTGTATTASGGGCG